uniref:GDSL esterase/lipase EXL3-like n=1 Tax=Nelumbo nucifera TaxID=4432 RepID=A0A822ZF92_NELNU|nr:TPA_asm: hypothetical protein HUJ06_015999 [Nelumbo nucifera]
MIRLTYLTVGLFSSSFSSTLTIIFFSPLLFSFSFLDTLVALPHNVTIPALIVFGDSIVDTGNNNNLLTAVKCNFPPYGRDFMGGIPTGRFSNGRVPSDLLVQEIGIKELLPAYLDPDLQTEDLHTGVSFASGGAGFDPLTAQASSVLSLPKQLELFKEYIGKLNEAVGEERSSTIVSESLYVIGAGSDDIANTYFGATFRRLHYDIPSYTDLMVQEASGFVQELYELGGRRIGVFSSPPIGCVPSQRTQAGGIYRECAEEYNQVARLFNAKLSSQLNSLRHKLPGTRLLYIDVYSPLLDIIQRPQDYGFEEVSKGCCGTGKIEVTLLCNDLNPFTCADVSKYVFWDSFHPTQKAYKALFGPLLRKYLSFFY